MLGVEVKHDKRISLAPNQGSAVGREVKRAKLINILRKERARLRRRAQLEVGSTDS